MIGDFCNLIYHTIDVIVINKCDFCLLGVAYDLYRNTIYWTNSDRVIVQSSLSSGDSISIREPDGSRTSIAVDYIGQRLYWIESNSVC